MRISGSIERVPVLVVIGVTQEGQKKVLGFQSGDKESASTWREFFKDLKGRGLDGSKVILGVMDGLPGLEKVFRGNFPGPGFSGVRYMWQEMFWPRFRRS